MIDKKRKVNESVIADTGDIYRISEGGQYLKDFKKEKLEISRANCKGKFKISVIYFNERPVYICDFGLDRQELVNSFFEERNVKHDEIYSQLVETFDDSFVRGDYGKQKKLYKL